ncbi:AAA family ATPase [Acinetobacter baumannii]|nr:AAA family ATPase [Acinetobacter baumannii]
MEPKRNVISFINMKGGVGKTTLCVSVGEYLAHYKDKRILFVDLDPQFNLTQSIMDLYDRAEDYLEHYTERNNIKTLLEDKTSISEQPSLPKKEDIILSMDENIDIIPGTINLIMEDNDTKGSKARRLRKFIRNNELKVEYDFILIDCPPTISLYTDTALNASDYYLVPNKIDRYSTLGIKTLKKVIGRLKFDNDIDINPLGIVYTMVGEETKKTREIKEKFEYCDFVDEIGLFRSKTRLVKDLRVGYQGNIASKYKNSREDIEKVCEELIERIG